MTMTADVLKNNGDSLFVRDWESGQEVQVNLPRPCRLCPGDRVCIRYDGIMTLSLPPQIAAQSVRKLRPC